MMFKVLTALHGIYEKRNELVSQGMLPEKRSADSQGRFYVASDFYRFVFKKYILIYFTIAITST